MKSRLMTVVFAWLLTLISATLFLLSIPYQAPSQPAFIDDWAPSGAVAGSRWHLSRLAVSSGTHVTWKMFAPNPVSKDTELYIYLLRNDGEKFEVVDKDGPGWSKVRARKWKSHILSSSAGSHYALQWYMRKYKPEGSLYWMKAYLVVKYERRSPSWGANPVQFSQKRTLASWDINKQK